MWNINVFEHEEPIKFLDANFNLISRHARDVRSTRRRINIQVRQVSSLIFFLWEFYKNPTKSESCETGEAYKFATMCRKLGETTQHITLSLILHNHFYWWIDLEVASVTNNFKN
jgi:hypothetical protein